MEPNTFFPVAVALLVAGASGPALAPTASAQSSLGPPPACIEWSPSEPIPKVDPATCLAIVMGYVALALGLVEKVVCKLPPPCPGPCPPPCP